MSWYQYESNTLILKCYIQPNSKHCKIIGIMQDELKIKLSSQAIEGRANQDLIKFLAQLFKVPQTNIIIKSGKKSRHKTLEISNSPIDPEKIVF